MKATITNVEVQTGNQLNVEVNYEDKKTGFSRKKVFTIPATDIDRLSKPGALEEAIQAQGKEFKDIDQSKDLIIAMKGQEFDIK